MKIRSFICLYYYLNNNNEYGCEQTSTWCLFHIRWLVETLTHENLHSEKCFRDKDISNNSVWMHNHWVCAGLLTVTLHYKSKHLPLLVSCVDCTKVDSEPYLKSSIANLGVKIDSALGFDGNINSITSDSVEGWAFSFQAWFGNSHPCFYNLSLGLLQLPYNRGWPEHPITPETGAKCCATVFNW